MQGEKLDYDFNLKDYIFTTKKVLRRRSEDSVYFDEHYSFIMYIKLFAYNMKLEDLSDID